MYSATENFYSSDKKNLAMDAKSNFDNILSQLEQSQLNFKLELSPFSALISVKKS
jgi:hypothetical protein